MTSFVFCGDSHVDKVLNGKHINKLPYRVYDMLQHLQTVVDFANKHKVDYFFHGGDVYDRAAPAQRYKVEVHRILNQLEMKAFILVGNHDTSPSHFHKNALYEFTSLGHERITVVHEPAIFDLGELNLLAIPWCYDGYELPEIDRKNTVVIGHLTVPELVRFEPTSREFIISAKDFEYFKFVLLSHIHEHIKYKNIIYPGSFGYLDWGEFKNKPHGFLYYNGNKMRHIKFKDRQRYLTEVVEGNEELPAIDEESMYRFIVHNNVIPTTVLQERYKNTMSLDIVTKRDKIDREMRLEIDYRQMTDIELLKMFFDGNSWEFDEEIEELAYEILS